MHSHTVRLRRLKWVALDKDELEHITHLVEKNDLFDPYGIRERLLEKFQSHLADAK